MWPTCKNTWPLPAVRREHHASQETGSEANKTEKHKQCNKSSKKKCCTENTNKLIFIMYEVKLLNFDFHQNYVIFHT